jgi:hypothetical protein
MLLLKGYISNFTCAKYYFLYVEFSDFYVNQSLAGQTIVISVIVYVLRQNFRAAGWWREINKIILN